MTKEEFKEMVGELMAEFEQGGEMVALIEEGKQFVEEFKEHDTAFSEKVGNVISSLTELRSYVTSRAGKKA
jgi:hypothetical protein